MEWDQTYEIGYHGRLEVDQSKGRVRITGWEGSAVQLLSAPRGKAPGDGGLVKAFLNRNTLRLEVGRGFGFGFLGPAVDLEIRVPFGTECEIQTGSGDVAITDTRGDVQLESNSGTTTITGVAGIRAQTGAGDVVVRNAAGDVSVESGSGRIEAIQIKGDAHLASGSGDLLARRIQGDLNLATGAGTVYAEDVDGEVRLETGGGDVRVRRLRGPECSVETGGGVIYLSELDVRNLSLETGGGDIVVELARVQRGDSYSLETGGGAVSVAVPPDAGMDIEVEYEHGRVRHGELPLRVEHSEPGEFGAILNGGGASLRIETGAGDVRLKPYQPPAAATAGLARILQADAALGSSEHIQRVVAMVEQGKLTPEEAERLLAALDEEAPV